MNVLVIEASTSSAKAMLYRDQSNTYAVHQIKYPSRVSDIKTQDIDGIMDTVFACAGELIEKAQADVDIIATASVWHSYLLLDRDGKPVSRVKTWADTQGMENMRKYREEPSTQRLFYQNTGCNIHSKYPCWKWFHDRQELERPDSLLISSVPEYLFERLTGERAVSRTVASGTGFLNIHTVTWDRDVLNFCGLKESQLSPLAEYEYCGSLSRTAADRLGLAAGIPVIITGADGALNQIGDGALHPGVMTMSVGTSSAIRISSRVPILPREPATWCYYVGDGIRLVGAATAAGGNCTNWFVEKVLRDTVSFVELERALTHKDTSAAPIFLPFLYGEQSPGWDDSRLGMYCGLSGENDVYDMYYSVLEGVLFNLYHCYTLLSQLMDTPSEIRLSGGIINSPYWVQMAADIFGIPIAVSRVEHGSMMGALAIAKKIMGSIESIEEYANEPAGMVLPGEGSNAYERRYARYADYYQRVSHGGIAL